MRSATETSVTSRLSACVALSMLLHALVLMVTRERALGRIAESTLASQIEVTLRPILPQREASRTKTVRERTARIGAEIAKPSEPADKAEANSSPEAAGERSAPHIDLEAARELAREIARSEARSAPKSLWPAGLGAERGTPLGRAIERAARIDCRVAYAGAGLLAPVFLLKDAIAGDGCRW